MDQESANKKVTIVFVDDDTDILDFYLDAYKDKYHVITATSAAQALEKISSHKEKNTIAAIVSDHLMPKMTGVMFFQQVASLLPKAQRILVTGQQDPATIVKAINDAKIHCYIQKPVNLELLTLEISSSLRRWSQDLEIEWLYQETQRLNRDLERRVQEKAEQSSSLLRIVCHDLATPLAIVSGSSMILDRKIKGREEEKKLVGKIIRASNMIAKILDEVRSLQAISAGKRTTHLEEYKVLELMDEISFMFEGKLQEKDLTLKTIFEKDCALYCDPSLLKTSIIGNLISNAIKFSQRGGEIICQASQEGYWTHIEIKDSGVGIPEKILQNLFSHTKETTRKGTGGEVGTGFGMPIVKASTEASGGKIKVETNADASKGPTGTTFRVSFPRSFTAHKRLT